MAAKATPIRICTEAESEQSRREIDFCYICGKRLPTRDSAQWKSDVDRDHIVPVSKLGDAPSSGAWAPILDCHKECNKLKNKSGDEAASLLHKIQTLAPSEWPKQVRSLDLEPVTLSDKAWSRDRTALGVDARVYNATWYWVRGLHAILYRQYLSDRMPFVPLAPAPEGRSGVLSRYTGRVQSPVSVQKTARYKSTVLATVMAASDAGTWDGIVAWDGRLEYIVTWLPKRIGKHIGKRMAIASWILNFAGLLAYAHGTEWKDTPWLGSYRTPRPPKQRQTVTREQLDKQTSRGTISLLRR